MLIEPPSPLLPTRQQPSFREDVKVLGHGRSAQPEDLREMAETERTPVQGHEDAEPTFVRESLRDGKCVFHGRLPVGNVIGLPLSYFVK
jgi:hypothetical protein